MKPLVIYHASCADGFGAAFAAWLKLGDDAEYVPMQYGKETDQFFTLEDGTFDSDLNILNREIFILDFSFPRWVMDGLFSNAKRVVWLDHHKTAFEMWCGEVYGNDNREHWFDPHYGWNNQHHIHLNNYKSGAMLAWEYFHPGTEVPMLIKHIDDRDRWVFALEGTKELHAALWTAPWNFLQWKELMWSDLSPMYNAGKAILRAHNQNVQSVVKGAARNCSIVPAVIGSVESYKSPWVWWNDPEHGDTCGANGLAANCPPHLQSDVGHELANQSGTFGLLWSIDKDGQCKCSLRSNGGYDVSAIAKAFGGGGHRNAAGFTTSIQTLLEWIK